MTSAQTFSRETPKEAAALAEKLFLLDQVIFDRADDSDGCIGDDLRAGCVLWLDAAAAVRARKTGGGPDWPALVYDLYQQNDFGVREPLLEQAHRLLHEEELRALATLTDQPPNTLAGIFAAYADKDLTELRPTTQKQYTYFLFGILTKVFGHLTPDEIDDSIVAQYLAARKNAGAAVSGNRERACLSSVYEFAMRQGWARRNPCRGVRRNKERGSKKDVDSTVLSGTMDRAPDHFARAMQLAYITGMRGCDLVLLEVSAVTPKGLEWTESKTGKRVTMEWTDTLRVLVRQILEARQERINRPYANKYAKPRVPQSHTRLLVNRLGNPITERGIISNMQRLDPGFTFRHIRPKAQTDGGDERNMLGHMGQMRERYTRRRKLVPVR